MPYRILHLVYPLFLVGCMVCCHRPSKVEQMRQEKDRRDSVNYVQAQQNRHYSDSLLQATMSEVDQQLQAFVYSKNDKVEDHGHYVHRHLQTSLNPSRNFLQAYIADNGQVSLKSYYFGAREQQQRSLRLSVGEDYVQAEGSNHAFQASGWHEILTIEGNDALRLMAFIAERDQPIRVSSQGRQTITYPLPQRDQQALSATYRLAVLMRNIDALERAIQVSNMQIEKYEKKHLPRK